MFRILVLGDSSTFAYGNDMEDGYVKVLERRLNAILNKKYDRIEVINAGHPGYNTYDEYNYLLLYGLKYSPDLIVVGVMSNDSRDSLELVIIDGVDSSPGSFWLKWNVPAWVKRTLRQSHLYIAIGWVRANHGFSIRQPTLDLKNEQELKRILDNSVKNFSGIIDLARENNISVYFITIPNRWETMSKRYVNPLFYQYLERSDKNGEAVFLDMLSAFVVYSEDTDKIFAFMDSAHPNAKGNQILGDNLYQRLKSFIQ